MFDLGWAELFVIAIVALIVIGPRDLPQTMRLVSSWFRKARSLTREFQSGIEELAKQAELDEVKADIKAMVDYNPDAELRETLDPGGKISANLPSPSDIYDDDDDADSKTEDPMAAMDIHDAMDDAAGDAGTDVETTGSKEPDAIAARVTAADDAPGADEPGPSVRADSNAVDAKPADSDAPLGTVMGPVPAKAKAKAGARRA